MKGKIARIFPDKFFGFIKGEDNTDYFFHRSAVKNANFDDLQVNDPVTFEESMGSKGARAEDVYCE